MADRKISDLTALTTPATGDLIPIVDISEAAAADKNKSITVGELLRGAPDGTAAAPGFAFESDGGNGMFLGGTDILAFSTGGTQAVTIDASQRLGVGTSSPSALLSVFQSAEGEVANFGTSDTSRLLRIVTGTANSVSGALITLKTDSAEGEIAFGTGGGTERVRIDSSGRVGIGVTSPINALHINGAAGATSSRFRLSSTEGSGFTIRSESATETMLNVDSSENLLFGIGGGEVGRFDSSGRLLVGTSADFTGGSANTLIQARTDAGARIALARNDGSVVAGDDLGRIEFWSNARASSNPGAYIIAEADGSMSASSKLTRLLFMTTPSGEVTPTERMRIDSNGAVHIFNNIRPWSDNTSQLGTASRRWSTVFAATGTINTSDANLKQDVENLEQAELNIAIAIKGLIKKYRFIDAVQIKGDDARIHVGVIAQEVEQAFIDEGLDPRRYALFCEDTLEDGSKRLGIRYDELLAFVIAAL